MTIKFVASMFYTKFTGLEELKESRGMLMKKYTRCIGIMKYNGQPFLRQG
jgi:hypothetical protein